MVQKSSKGEEGCESAVHVYPACKPARNASSELVGLAQLQDMGLDMTSKLKTRKAGNNSEATPSPRSRHHHHHHHHHHHPFEDTVLLHHRKVVGETTAETMSLLSASVENYSCPDHHNSDQLVGISKQVVPSVSSFQYHVLAVDDSRIDQRVIEKLLKTSSYKVTTVNSALRALEVLGLSDSPPSSFKKLDINLIMTDYCMPEMTGYDLLKRVKAKTSALKEIPVVVMSSENDSNRITRCLAEGAEEFIIKPVKMSDVKRLRGHMIKCPSTTSSSGTGESSGSGSTCGKRKADPSEDLHEVSSPERRPRLSELLVT